MSALLEYDPASDWCQRWRARQHSWRHRSEGGFEAERYSVEPISEDEAKVYVCANHYSGTFPASSRRLGLHEAGCLVGVAVFGIPVQKAVLTNVFPSLEPYVESLELSRFVLDDSCPGNAESWFLARCFEELAPSGLRGVVAFSDPVPRQLADGLLFPGHIGRIYQASNALHLGRGRARKLTVVPKAGGVVLNDRSLAKVRSQDRGHEHVERRLCSWGARPMRAGEKPAAWLAEALEAIGAEQLKHGGNFRYAFALGTKAERRRLDIAGERRPFPKETDHAA